MQGSRLWTGVKTSATGPLVENLGWLWRKGNPWLGSSGTNSLHLVSIIGTSPEESENLLCLEGPSWHWFCPSRKSLSPPFSRFGRTRLLGYSGTATVFPAHSHICTFS